MTRLTKRFAVFCSVLVLFTLLGFSGQPARAQATNSSGTSYQIFIPLIQNKSNTDIIPSSSSWWKPTGRLNWQIQFTGSIDLSVNAQVFVLDMVDTTPQMVSQIHARGAKAVCYISMGSWEDWRPDAAAYPASILGNDYEGWPGERWVDIRALNLLGPILQKRMDLCKSKGFDAIEPDNIDSYNTDTGFPLTAQDQLVFNRWLASEAHKRGLSIGLQEDMAQAKELEPAFDWGMTESCFAHNWCSLAKPFSEHGKTVFQIEYTDAGVSLDKLCAQAASLGYSAILKNPHTDAYRASCQ